MDLSLMQTPYPGYDVLAKRGGLSWNDPTREAIDERLAAKDEPVFLSPAEWRAMQALCDRILPVPDRQPPLRHQRA